MTTGACGSLRPGVAATAARGLPRTCGRRSPSAAHRGSRGSAGRPAAPSCRRRAAPRRSARPGPCSRTMPSRITTTWSAISPTTPRSWLMNSMLMRCLRLQAREQLEDLALHRHVERRGRLVGDQQLRLARERHRDHHALLLPAGELVRIRAEPALRLGQAHLGEQALGLLQRGAPRQTQVPDQRLADLLADGEHRVQRRHRLLEHAGDVAAAQALQLGQLGMRAGRAPGT